MPFNTTFMAKSLIIYSANPPGDTNILWYDTEDRALKYYNKTSSKWERVINITEELLSIVIAMCDGGGV